jgi:NAD(P)-dependent dehydrogenase (short-subunit alcohol dehydrogenase family)
VSPLAAELAPVGVNAVSPGIIDTPWWSFLPEDQKQAQFAAASDMHTRRSTHPTSSPSSAQEQPSLTASSSNAPTTDQKPPKNLIH